MLRTYKAVLRGNRVEWIDAPPAPTRPTPVHITLLDENAEPARARGPEMARALEALAQRGGLSGIPDPVSWQRELRQERSLPGRGD
ncbi:MAG: hypothetical protein KY467_03355 [Gemmatimonadetes bacterium]|nr:hypothetical protein [Gemmatimonadota bacterium]